MSSRNLKKALKMFNCENLSKSSMRLAANIQFLGSEKRLNKICVTSSSKDEGKTTVSTNLACSFAENGFKTVLIDTDIHHKSISKIFKNSKTFAEVLSNNEPIANACNATPVANLFFVDCASHISSISQLCSSDAFSIFMNYLQQSFDFIIFDTPPLLSCVDATIISKICDGAVFVVRQDYTKQEEIEIALEQLKVAKANIFGFVLTFAKGKNNYYYDYSYGGK